MISVRRLTKLYLMAAAMNPKAKTTTPATPRNLSTASAMKLILKSSSRPSYQNKVPMTIKLVKNYTSHSLWKIVKICATFKPKTTFPLDTTDRCVIRQEKTLSCYGIEWNHGFLITWLNDSPICATKSCNMYLEIP